MTPTKPESRPRRGRLVRDPSQGKRWPFAAIERGPEILRLLDAFLYLTNDQVETLIFGSGSTATGKARAPRGAAYAANTALRRLFDAGYLDRVPVFLPTAASPVVKPHYVNVLARRGARVAADLQREVGRRPRWRHALLPRPWQPIGHGYRIREFAVRMRAACERAGWRWWSWFDDRQLAALKTTHGARFATVPDGFFVITHPATGRHFPHFLEIDLGTESVAAHSARRRDWRGKVEGYLAYIRHDFREQFGLDATPVVLTVTESERRLAHLLEATAAVGGGGRFWFTTFARLAASGASAGGDGGVLWEPLWRVPSASTFRSVADRCGAVPRAAQPAAERETE